MLDLCVCAGYTAVPTAEAAEAGLANGNHASASNAGVNEIVTEENLQRPAKGGRKGSIDFYEDEDVLREEERVARGDVPDSAPVVIRNLRKLYPVRRPTSACPVPGAWSRLPRLTRVFHVLRRRACATQGRLGQPPKIALHNLSLVIDENECFGLLGANGAGQAHRMCSRGFAMPHCD